MDICKKAFPSYFNEKMEIWLLSMGRKHVCVLITFPAREAREGYAVQNAEDENHWDVYQLSEHRDKIDPRQVAEQVKYRQCDFVGMARTWVL